VSNNWGYELITANYFACLERSERVRRMCRSSFCEARDKLKHDVFIYLLEKINDGEPQKKWRGHTVRAVDGTKVQLPHSKEILSEFPIMDSHFGRPHYPFASVMAATNINSKSICKVRVGNKHQSERNTLRELIKEFSAGDICLLDRGFEGPELWKDISDQNQFFICRIRAKGKPSSKETMVSIETESGALHYRIIKGPQTKSGKSFYLTTNLDEKYSRKEILKLYKERQAVEDSFLNLKQNLNVKNIRSKKVNGILQEILAAVLMTSIVAFIRYDFERKMRREIQVSFRALTWRIGNGFYILLGSTSLADFYNFFDPIKDFYHLKQRGRSYPRYSKQPENKWTKEKRAKSRTRNGG
jgi:hypothetical protein